MSQENYIKVVHSIFLKLWSEGEISEKKYLKLSLFTLSNPNNVFFCETFVMLN